jgi:hypothetical protein
MLQRSNFNEGGIREEDDDEIIHSEARDNV